MAKWATKKEHMKSTKRASVMLQVKFHRLICSFI